MEQKPKKIILNGKKIILLASVILAGSLMVSTIETKKYSWTAIGEGRGDNFGTKVAGAGDINGDGYADAAVWASNFDQTSGKMYVFLGSAKGLARSPAWSVAGESKGDDYGHSFGGVGDVNGDGFGDFIVAAQGYGLPNRPGAGKAYLYLGSAHGLAQTPAWTHVGSAPSENFGDCSGPAGDINGDGLSDVIVGAYGYDQFRGAAYLFLGSKQTILSPAPAWKGEGEVAGDWFGYSVSSAGDVNHDGSLDVIIGAKQAGPKPGDKFGRAYVYEGSKNGLFPKPSWTAQGEKAQDLFGWRALKAGDVNGDGYGDVVVSAYSYSANNKGNCGKVYVYLGGPNGLSDKPSWEQEGEMSGAFYGSTIAAGDFNKDGFSDILVGSPNCRPGGKVYLYLGSAKGLSNTPSDTASGEMPEDHFGAYVANAGDINGDGFPDILVGAPENSENGSHAGKTYLFYGGKNGKLNQTPRSFLAGLF